MKIKKSNYPVNLKSVDEISELVQAFLRDCGVEQGICVRMRLVVEETLISLVEMSKEEKEIDLFLTRRFGKPWITMVYGGEKLDPTDRTNGDTVSDMILNGLGIQPRWTYRLGYNRITLTVPSQGIKTEVQLLAALGTALVLGLCAPMISPGIKEALIQYLLTPVSDIYMKLLMTLAPLLVFLSVINSIIRTGQGADFGRLGRYVITRYLAATAVLAVIYTIVLVPFFNLHFEDKVSTSNSFQKIYDLVINILPGNIVLPFSENNTMQIIILALFLGVVIINLDNRLETLRSTLLDLYAVFLNGVEMIGRFLPLFIFASLLKMFWETGLGDAAKLWKPILAAVTVSYLFVFTMGLIVSLRYRVSLVTLFRKILPTYLIGVTTSSSLVAMPTGLEVNKNRLGISESYTNLAYPLGLNIYAVTFCSVLLSTTYYLAEIYQVAVSPEWIFTAGLICTILAIANPPVTGGILVSLGIIMSQLNIPSQGLAIAGTLALILDFLITGSKVMAHHFEMVLQAGHQEMLDQEILRDPEKM